MYLLLEVCQRRNFNLDFNFNIAYNKNHIAELNTNNPWQSPNWAGSTLSKYEDFRLFVGVLLFFISCFNFFFFYTASFAVNYPNGLLLWNLPSWFLLVSFSYNSHSISCFSFFPSPLSLSFSVIGFFVFFLLLLISAETGPDFPS